MSSRTLQRLGSEQSALLASTASPRLGSGDGCLHDRCRSCGRALMGASIQGRSLRLSLLLLSRTDTGEVLDRLGKVGLDAQRALVLLRGVGELPLAEEQVPQRDV